MQSTLRIDVKFRDRFLVNYVYGFNSSSHVYFVTVQRKSHLPGHEEQGYITRLARVCVTDANFDTYTEVTLTCGANSNSDSGFNIAQDAVLVEQSVSLSQSFRTERNDSFLVATFGRSQGSSSRAQNTSSAVCIYSLADIDRMFDENIHNCFNGSMRHRNMEYVSGTILEGKCPDKLGSSGNILNFCEVGLKISGRTPISASPVYVEQRDAITAVTYNDVPPRTDLGVLVLGTATGRVEVVIVSSSSKASRVLTTHHLPERTAVSKVRVLGHHSIVALQKHTLSKFPIAECTSHSTCGDCVAARNPFCGWCSLENRCVDRYRCKTRDWLSMQGRNGQKCSKVEQVIPSSLSFPTSVEHITLLISALPDLPPVRWNSAGGGGEESYICVFGGNVTAVRAKIVSGGLQCAVPSADAFAAYLEESSGGDENGDKSISVDIKFANLGTTLVTTSVQLLDCGKAESCGACTSHPGCHWCLETNHCVATSDSRCYQTVRGRGEGLPSPSCPRLKPDHGIRVPNDVPLRLQLPFAHLPSYYNTAKVFWCLVHIEGAKFKVSARMNWENATVTCDETMFNFNAPASEIEADVSVLVNTDGNILDTVSIAVFKCSVLGSFKGAQDCTLCTAKARSHGCAWCPNLGCVSSSQCPSHGSGSGMGRPIVKPEMCPAAEIYLIRPTSGPYEGGTEVTIEGSNLGTTLADLQGKIKIGGKDCIVTSLRNSVEATCITPRLSPQQNPNATVVLRRRTRGGASRRKPLQFFYLNYSVASFTPSKGAASGGALVRIRGQNLHIGKNIVAYFDEVPCLVEDKHRSPHTILCRTGAVGEQRVAQNLTVVIDGASRSLSDPFFCKLKLFIFGILLQSYCF